jgi:hypothetical protein
MLAVCVCLLLGPPILPLNFQKERHLLSDLQGGIGKMPGRLHVVNIIDFS